MPPSNGLFARLFKLSLLCALLAMGLSPGALAAQTYSSSATGLHAQATNPSISLTPRLASEGPRLDVRGQGFAPNSTITLRVDGNPVSTNCKADASGSFSSCVFTPPAETSGTHTVTASDTSANSASAIYSAATFAAYLNPAPPQPRTSSRRPTNTGNPTVSVSPGDGGVGATRSVSGSGFEHDQTITLLFDGSPVATSCRTKGDGSFRFCTFTVPAAGPGTHTVTASDDNANSASGRFVLNSGITLTPNRGPVGSGAAVSGSGFTPNSPITVTFAHHHVSTDCRANAVGSFNACAFTVPDAGPGAHIVTASDYAGTNPPIVGFYHSRSASYSVTPGVSLDPEAGSVGRTVRVSGGNFKPHRILRVSFDGSRRPTSGNCTTRDSGNLPKENDCTFTVPTQAAGSYNVTLTDGTYSYTTPYTVKPDMSLSFDEGAVGSAVAVSGSGYSTLRSVFLDFGDTRVALTTSSGSACTTGAQGGWNCVFRVPNATAGSHTVTALDDNGFSDSTHFKVTSSVDLPSRSGPVGGQASVNGTGFNKKDTVTVTFGDRRVSTDCKTDANGSVGPCGFTVPQATLGDHKVTVSDGKHSAWELYTVTPGGISLNATAGVAGSTILLSGGNYTPNSTLTVRFDGSKVSTTGTCTTDAKGNLPATNSCAFTVPTTTAGPHTVAVSDGTYSGSTTYTVNTALSVTPQGGPVGSGAAVSGSGFAPFSPVKVTVGDSRVDTASACTTDAKGTFSFCAFTVPDMHVGTYTVTAQDGSGYSASASFIVEPAISLSATAGAVGSTITLSGSNYKPNSTVTVKLDGEKLNTSGSCTTDASGKLTNCAFKVPAATAGDHTLMVSDGTYSSTYTLTVNPALSLSPSAGSPGSSAAVSGSGYAPFAAITGSFDGSGVTLTGSGGTPCQTDAKGSFSNCAYTVPVRPAGLRAVTASDGTNSGTATYMVSPGVSLSPSQGPVGASVTVNGTGYTAFAPITVTIGGSTVTTPNCQANASGRVSGCTFTFPATTAGEHTVTTTDGTYTGTATYTVGPSLSLIGSGTGAPGTSLAVRGTGFSQGSVTLTFDGSTVSTSCDATADGNVNACTFTVPAAAAGRHTVTATDKKGFFASAIFNI